MTLPIPARIELRDYPNESDVSKREYVRSGAKPRWRKEEIDLLLTSFKDKGADYIALIVGRTPFAVEQKARKLGLLIKEDFWNRSDDEYLRANYASQSLAEMSAHLNRTVAAIRCRARLLGLRRPKRRCPVRSSAEYRRAYRAAYANRRFFYMRASKSLAGCGIPAPVLARALWSKWKMQRGRCAITGIKLTKNNAHLDHIVPIARGGRDSIENLRWICADANLLKSSRTDAELALICQLVLVTIGSAGGAL